jgi:acetylxylan esterase
VGPGKDFQPEALREGEQKVGIDQYAAVLRDYCNKGDQYCAKSSSPLALENHLMYFVQFQQDVVDWVVKTVKG